MAVLSTPTCARATRNRLSWILSLAAFFPFGLGLAFAQPGSLDPGFNAKVEKTAFNATVNAIAIQHDQKIVIGGYFDTVNGAPRRTIARLLSDGALDPGFAPQVVSNSLILTLALQADGKIVVAGNFTEWNGQPRNHIARLNPDGTLDADFNPSIIGNN